MKETNNGHRATKQKISPRPYKDFIFAHYVHIAILALGLFIGILLLFKPTPPDWPVCVTIVGGIISFVFLVQKHRLEDLRLFKELFSEFNEKYSSLNEKINGIVRDEDKSQPLSSMQKDALYDYFNLCGEEYLFYKEGYILREVWDVWVDGMAFFYEADPRIRELWKVELDLNPYYGFNLDSVRNKTQVSGV